ncbi:MAG: hypothetical protein EOP47_30795, partial [Sphingobacteriaceae bacterium]
MKLPLTVGLLFLSITCFAQRQNVYFLRTDGTSVSTKDSADFIRIISEPDSGNIYFKVAEYYKSRKPKLIGESSTVEPLTFENSMINYFPDGKKQNISNYKGGKITGSSYSYYPNGKLKSVEIYPDSLTSRP